MEKKKPQGAKQQRAVPPDLIGGPLSPKNAAWLAEQQQKERDHKRRVAAAIYQRESELGRGRRAYGATGDTAVLQEVSVELVGSSEQDADTLAVLVGTVSLLQTQEGEV